MLELVDEVDHIFTHRGAIYSKHKPTILEPCIFRLRRKTKRRLKIELGIANNYLEIILFPHSIKPVFNYNKLNTVKAYQIKSIYLDCTHQWN